MIEQFPVHIPQNQTPKDHSYYEQLSEYFKEGIGTNLDKLRAFTKYTPVAEINRFLAKSKLFEKIINVHGNIIECGVFMGGGLMTWAQLSAIYEPLNHIRKVIGFDTFEGFTGVSDKDKSGMENNSAVKGGLKVTSYEDILECVRIFDLYRPLGHIQKVELVKGDVLQTMKDYIEQNQHLVVALLYLDFDLYEPTKFAIETLAPRMPKGSIIAFDQLNQKFWPGETLAILETLGLKNLRLERFIFQPQISYAVL
jgi:Macrocin-O-methyltransferase (TylF)